jgi:predicted peptidase
MVSFAIGRRLPAAQSQRSQTAPQPGRQTEEELTVTMGEGSDERDIAIPYLLYVPAGYSESQDGEPWPLMLFLHGLGESGDGQLQRVRKHGPPKIVERQKDFPFIVVAPQCPWPQKGQYRDAWKPDLLMRLIDHVSGRLRVDADRVYVTGLSMGGYGTWRLAAAYPERFAAAVPICGGGDPNAADQLARVPIWCFHGAKDPVVPLSESEKMVEAIKKANGEVRLTVYPNAKHDSWTETYDNPKVYEWLLSHRRPKQP